MMGMALSHCFNKEMYIELVARYFLTVHFPAVAPRTPCCEARFSVANLEDAWPRWITLSAVALAERPDGLQGLWCNS